MTRSERCDAVRAEQASIGFYESSFTHCRKRSPRSSKSLNSSKLVPPGESRTTSPGLGHRGGGLNGFVQPGACGQGVWALAWARLGRRPAGSFRRPRQRPPRDRRAGGPVRPDLPGQVLVAPAEQQHQRLVEGADGCDGAFGGGGDRVVVPARRRSSCGPIPGGAARR